MKQAALRGMADNGKKHLNKFIKTIKHEFLNN